jgi:hypothetical protein
VRFHHNAIFDARGFHHRARSFMARSDASHLAHVAHMIQHAFSADFSSRIDRG